MIMINNRRNTKRAKQKGSLTVEAALIMPIVIFTLFSLIYLAFYLHDICRIQGMVDKTLNKAGLSVKHEADIATGDVYYEKINDRGVFYLPFGSTKGDEDSIKSYLQKELSEGLFLTDIDEIEVKAGKFDISVSVDTELRLSLRGIQKFFEPYRHRIIEGKCAVHNPAETIRMSEVVLSTGYKIKGIKALKEKIEGFLK